MKWKTTLVLLLLTVGVGAYVSLYELRQPLPEEGARLAKELLRITPEEITRVIVVSPKARMTLERQSLDSPAGGVARDGAPQGVWRLTSLRNARANEELVHRLLNELNPLESEQTIKGTPDRPLNRADYGLQTPEATLTVASPQRSITLLFGSATAVEENRYVALEGPSDIAVVNASLFEALNQSPEAFRSHDLVDVKTWEVRQIAVTSANRSYTLAKLTNAAQTQQADRWKLLAPLEDVADSAAASTTLSQLRGLRIERFVAEELVEVDRARWGLDAPYATITLTTNEDQPPLEVVIGKVAEDDEQQRYAKRSDESTVYAVTSAQIDEVARDPHALRSRACFEFFASQVAKLQVSGEGASWTIERDGDAWKASDGIELDGAKVEEFLWKVRDIKLMRFVDDAPQDLARYGLDPTHGTIQVWLTGQLDPQTLAVGSTIETGTTRYGRITGRTAVVELPEVIHEILTTTPEYLNRAIGSIDGPA